MVDLGEAADGTYHIDLDRIADHLRASPLFGCLVLDDELAAHLDKLLLEQCLARYDPATLLLPDEALLTQRLQMPIAIDHAKATGAVCRHV